MKYDQTDKNWDDFLSSAAQLSETDHASTASVLGALKLERERAEDPGWTSYLSNAAQLRPIDIGVVAPTLQALKLERQKRKVLRLNLTRAVAGFAAAAVAAVAFVTFSPVASADPSEAYNVYQEANVGW